MAEAVDLGNARRFLRERRFSAVALAATVILLVLSLTQPGQESEWLYRDNGIVVQHLQILYGLLVLGLVPIFLYEPLLRRELREAHALGLVVFVGMCACFLVVRFIKPDQAWRFFRTPGLLWWVIAHAVLLCALAVLLVLEHPDAPASQRMRRYALMVVALGGGVLLILHIASVGSFMGLDLPDEVWLGGLATNYATRGDFYSPYLAGAFGNPDPLLPRYYLLMGEWIRLAHDSSLVTLRAFSLLIGAVGVGMTAVILRTLTRLTGFQVIVGLVVMLGFSPLVRTSHNLRMDVGLSIYGALLLAGLLGFLKDGRGRWVVLLGVALIIGMEVAPLLAVSVNFTLGCALIVLALRRRATWRQVVLYAGACLGAGLIYFGLHFLPDIAVNLKNYSNYTSVYYQALGRVAFDPANLLILLKSSTFLSPVEVILIAGVAWAVRKSDQTLLLIVAAAAVIGLAGESRTYGYVAAFAPFLAYFAARAFRSQVVVVLGAFLLIPGMLSAPIFDMTTSSALQTNQRLLYEIGLLSWRVPEGATVWGDAVFWFTLHDKVNFIGRPGPQNVASVQGVTIEQAVDRLGIDVIICNEGDTEMCAIGERRFGAPYEFDVTNGSYLMYSRLGSE